MIDKNNGAARDFFLEKKSSFFFYWLPDALVFTGACALFLSFWVFEVRTDIQLHAHYVVNLTRGAVPPPANFLYYLFVYLLSSLGARSWTSLGFASAVLLGAAVGAKFSITRRILAVAEGESMLHGSREPSVRRTALMFSLALLLAFNLPMQPFYINGYFYLGQIPPNVWHNSTTIFLMPFALLLFWSSYRQLREPENKKRIWLILLLLALNLFTKPSFFFPFVAVYPLFMLKRMQYGGNARLFLLNMLPVILAGLLILGMYLLIYVFSFGTTNVLHTGKSGVAFAPFLFWRHFSPNILISLLFSVLFPAAYALLYPEECKKMQLHYAWSLYCVALIIFILFAETGPRAMHGNFFWQTVVCGYLLFFSTSFLFAKKLLAIGWKNWKNVCLLICLGAHVVSGAAYLIWLFIQKTFW